MTLPLEQVEAFDMVEDVYEEDDAPPSIDQEEPPEVESSLSFVFL